MVKVKPKLQFGAGVRATPDEKKQVLAVAEATVKLASGLWPLATPLRPASYGGQAKPIELSILFCKDDKIKELNYDFRGKDYDTNVLSFPCFSSKELAFHLKAKGKDACYLGDIAISLPVVAKEAGEQGKTMREHLLHMVVHGILHLFGYDHMNDKDAEEMEGMEIGILKKFGIPNPYL